MCVDAHNSKISLGLDDLGLRIGCRFLYPHQCVPTTLPDSWASECRAGVYGRIFYLGEP